MRITVGFLVLALGACSAGVERDEGPGAPGTPIISTSGAVTDQVNAYRRGQGGKALKRSRKLDQIAQAHADDMARNDFFSHTGSDGQDLVARARKAGYRICFIAENISFGQRSETRAVQAWIDSPGHRANMLNPKADEFGFARSGTKYVMVLGRDGC